MRIKHKPEMKAKLVLEALRGERTLNEIASEHNINPTLLTRWKKEAVDGLSHLFENENTKARQQAKENELEKEELYTRR